MLKANRLRKTDTSEAIAELDRAKDRLNDSIRFVYSFVMSDFLYVSLKILLLYWTCAIYNVHLKLIVFQQNLNE